MAVCLAVTRSGPSSPCFGNPMGNHNPEAWSAQANSEIGGTTGVRRNEKGLTWQQIARTMTPRASDCGSRVVSCYDVISLWVSSRAVPSVLRIPCAIIKVIYLDIYLRAAYYYCTNRHTRSRLFYVQETLAKMTHPPGIVNHESRSVRFIQW